MANLLWGKVYYQEKFAGILREEPGDRASFKYDSSYLNSGYPAIAHAMPLGTDEYMSQAGLHPFFDNLVAEGWLEHAQARFLGKRHVSRFELLLAFGYDCAGAVSVLDPEPAKLSDRLLDPNDPKEMALLTSRASLSGVQPKLAVIERNGAYFPTRIGELSTHIAKFPSQGHSDLILNEYLTTLAFKALLPDDDVVELSIQSVSGISEPALLIKRFDQTTEGRVHFEEFNQLLEKKSAAKYQGSHQEMSHFIRSTKKCLPVENYRLFGRIITRLLLGNTDMHLKNFAMFHTPTGLRLTPSYDQVAAAIYQYKTIALELAGIRDRPIGSLKIKHLIALAHEFELSKETIALLFNQLERNKESAKQAIFAAGFGKKTLKDQLIKLMETRWNGTFASIGQNWSMKL